MLVWWQELTPNITSRRGRGDLLQPVGEGRRRVTCPQDRTVPEGHAHPKAGSVGPHPAPSSFMEPTAPTRADVAHREAYLAITAFLEIRHRACRKVATFATNNVGPVQCVGSRLSKLGPLHRRRSTLQRLQHGPGKSGAPPAYVLRRSSGVHTPVALTAAFFLGAGVPKNSLEPWAALVHYPFAPYALTTHFGPVVVPERARTGMLCCE